MKKIQKIATSLALATTLSTATLVIPMVLQEKTVVQAADDTTTTVPPKVNLKIHKLMYDKKTGSNLDADKNGTIDVSKGEGLVNDGHEKPTTADLTTWDKSQYGDVGFTLYDFTNSIGNIKDLTESKINSIIADVEKNGTNSTYIKNAPSNPQTQDVDNNGIVSFNNMDSKTSNNDYKIYLAVETKTPKGFVTQKAKPMVIPMPLTTKDGSAYLRTAHFYPKNQKQKLAIQLRKKSKDIEKANAESLQGAKFQFYKGKAPSGTKFGNVLTTDKNGYVTVEDLTVNEYYFVEEPSSVADYADKVQKGDGKYIINANAMNTADNKLGFKITADGVAVVGNGDPNQSNIIVTSYETELTNYERPNITKQLTNGVDIEAGTVKPDGNFSFDKGSLSHHLATVTIPEDIAGGQNGISNSGTKYTTLPYSYFVVKDRPVTNDLLYVEAKGNIVVSTQADGKGTVFTHGTDYTTRTVKDNAGKVIGFDVIFVDEQNGKMCSRNLKAAAGKKVYINYDIVVDSNATIDKPLVNNIEVDWTVGGHQGKIPDKDELYTYAARIKKVDSGLFGSGVSSKALQGAEFVIKNDKGEYFAGKKDIDGDGMLNVIWTKDINIAKKDGKFVSGTDGLLAYGSEKAISGLAEGTYYAKEVKAPAGYNLLPDEVKFVVNKLTDGNTPQDLPPVEIKNDQTYIFHTGSREMLIVTAISVLSVGGGIAGFVIYRKRYAEETI